MSCCMLLVILGSLLLSSQADELINPTSQHVYMVMLTEPPVIHFFDEPQLQADGIYLPGQLSPEGYASYLTATHDTLLRTALKRGTYRKLYSYNHLVNGFAALLSSGQAETLNKLEEVILVERDNGVQKLTTYTPLYLGLPAGAWQKEGGTINAGEGIVIGLVDTGIDPTHPSFSDNTINPYPNATHYKGSCEIAAEFPQGSCNKKLVGAQHFAAAAIASGEFNATIDFASPLDADGHGTHTASTAAGNNGVEVIVDDMNFGFASGMAPRAHIAIYKALYKGFGGFLADVVAAVEQAVKDKVDILSLSIGPGGPPPGISTYFNIFDMAMLSANKAGVFVAQAAGNAGPSRQSILSFSPWICSVAASVHDRSYPNSIILGSNATVQGIGLATGTPGEDMYKLILASDALKDNSSDSQDDANYCQDSSLFNAAEVQGKVLICSYGLDYILRGSSMSNVIGTIKNLSAVGVVMVVTDDIEGEFSIPITPFPIPAIILTTTNRTKTVLDYYNSSPNFTPTIRILGGAKAKFSGEAPRVAKYSSRGPDSANDQFQVADVLKPNIMAPGSMIWAAWSAIGSDSSAFQGQKFAMISGTSMATPHIAGIAALLKKKNPRFGPAALASALATTAYVVDEHGKPLLAQNPSSNASIELGLATPFDFGGGAVNATAALDPGLVFDAGFEDYVKFLCTIPGAGKAIENATGVQCDKSSSAGMPTDLNLPSITIANLTGERMIPRTVTSVATHEETYTVKIVEPKGVQITIKPMEFTIASNQTQELSISISPTESSTNPRFGQLFLLGRKGHQALVPISIISSSIHLGTVTKLENRYF